MSPEKPGELAISIYPGQGTTGDGVNGDHVILAPPYNITAEDVTTIVELTGKAIDDVFEKLAKA